jgi:ATP-binding cassette subfamily F protein uup
MRQERRDQPGQVRLQVQEGLRSGRLVIEAEHLQFAYEDRPVVRDFSLTVQRGDRIGIIGPNGSGKTTLLRLLLGEIASQSGTIELGTQLEIAYFDQLRSQLDETRTILDNVGQGSDTVTINGKTRNLIGYLEDFLFSRERVHAPISALSGGERNRLLLARIFAHPANLLVMDEPTNDLDIDTLEILEDMLLEYGGTLLLVSHDRAFLNNLVTSTLVLDGSGQVTEVVGGYDDWLRQAQQAAAEKAADRPRKEMAAQEEGSGRSSSTARRLSYNEVRALEAQRRELAEMPGRIEALEKEQQRLTAAMGEADFYTQDSTDIARSAARLQQLEAEIADAYQRWETLETTLGES